MTNRTGIGKRAVWIGAIAVAVVTLIAGRGQAQQSAQPSPQPVAAATPDETPRITPEDVKALAAKGKVLIVDVRDKASYDFEHAEGAISVPLSDLEKRLAELPRNKQIAAYCT